jgi:hypothetical protein
MDFDFWSTEEPNQKGFYPRRGNSQRRSTHGDRKLQVPEYAFIRWFLPAPKRVIFFNLPGVSSGEFL